ncbi:hypothetical protein [Loktanella salsilacus]|jgi:hypothetical protein|uniref:Uncharacterized protein n=1 Tax=Loktanella salsilacus TaxID=195913 RepID=A0A1I4FTY8_9RHOB|nr:hypothetical protein [Loktanella salsilacus]UTH43508.1 hypothetical protein KBK07_10265 [Loktanella salsilacus]SFL21033.1 hypothetical protein SAMN04488004_110105 [Loktanella salsilacus]
MTYQTTEDRRRPFRTRLQDAFALPPDVLDDEITEITLFRMSLVLNRATFGPADMTFSARTALACDRGGKGCAIWRIVRGGIDLYCQIMRAEVCHCATALRNYHRRRG